MVLSTSKNHLTDSVESAEVGTVHESTVVGNRDGRSLIQQLGDLTANVSALDDKFSARIADLEAKHSAEIAAPEAQMSTLLPFKAYFLDVREHTYLTHLRDFWTEYGAASRQKGRYLPNSKAAEIQGKISVLNKVILHGGNAEVDALMLHERQPIPESKPFECLHGLRPETVRELASKGYRSVINLLSTAGSVHYESHHLTKAQQEAFDKVIELVNANKPEEAEKVAAKSSHLFDIFELAGVTPIQEE